MADLQASGSSGIASASRSVIQIWIPLQVRPEVAHWASIPNLPVRSTIQDPEIGARMTTTSRNPRVRFILNRASRSLGLLNFELYDLLRLALSLCGFQRSSVAMTTFWSEYMF